MKFPRLTKENFLLYAIKAYESPTAKSNSDFKKDMKTFPYIGKLLKKQGDESRWRLLLNHVVSLLNIFRPVATTRMLLFYFTGPNDRSIILSILDGLKVTPTAEKIPDLDILEIRRHPEVEAFMRTIK